MTSEQQLKQQAISLITNKLNNINASIESINAFNKANNLFNSPNFDQFLNLYNKYESMVIMQAEHIDFVENAYKSLNEYLLKWQNKANDQINELNNAYAVYSYMLEVIKK